MMFEPFDVNRDILPRQLSTNYKDGVIATVPFNIQHHVDSHLTPIPKAKSTTTYGPDTDRIGEGNYKRIVSQVSPVTPILFPTKPVEQFVPFMEASKTVELDAVRYVPYGEGLSSFKVVRREALVVVKDIIRGVEKNDIKVMNKYTVMLAQERSREEGFNLRFAVITQTLAEVGMDRILRTVKGKYPNTDKQIKQFWHTVALSEHMIQSRAGLRRFLRHKDYMRLMMSVFCAWERELRTKNIGKFDDYYRDNTMYSAFAIMERCIYKSKPNLELGMFFCYLIQVPPVVNIYGSARWRMGNIKWRYMLHYLNIAYCCDIFVPMTEEEERRVNYIELTSFYMILCSSPQCMALTQADRVFAHCGRCMMARYCSKECQRSHWKAGHKAHCMGYDVEQKHLPIQTSLQRLLLLRWTEWYNHYCLNAKNCKDLVLTA